MFKQTYDLNHVHLKVGTDCSGLETPLIALQMLKVNVEHVWSCEIDKHLKGHILKHHNPKHFFEDIMSRDHRALPDIDLYVCGFPCQPWSSSNKSPAGFDGQGGAIIFEVIKTIQAKQPQYFVLENVKGLLGHNKGKSFQAIKEMLSKLDYHVNYEVLNTRDFGIPQNRERLYIVGVKDKPLNFNRPIIKCPDLKDFLIMSPNKERLIPRRLEALNVAVKKHNIDVKDDWIVTVAQSVGSYTRAMKNMCPCLTTNCSKYYVTSQERFLTIREVLNLQGFPEEFGFEDCKTRTYKQVGNAMSVNVLYHIFYQLLC